MMVYQTWAKTAFESQMYRHIGKEQGIMMIILAAREYNIPPAMALNGGLKIINGQVEMSARIMESLIRRMGHQIKKVKHDTEICILRGTRCDTGESEEEEFTFQEAKDAGIVKEGGGWYKWRKDMLYARALSRLARRLFGDVIGVGYVQGEISGVDSETIVNIEHNAPIPIDQRIYDSSVVSELLVSFPEHEHQLLLDFVGVIAKHYKWPMGRAVHECINNIESTKIKFNEWKKKNEATR